MSRVAAVPITTQPINHEIFNTFALMGNETVLKEWKYEKRCCGPTATYYNTLTDARLLIRKERTVCCNKKNDADVSIFLRDIAQLRQMPENHYDSVCCTCCIQCCKSPKITELRGIFGSQILYIPEAEMDYLLIEIPRRVGDHKLISHH